MKHKLAVSPFKRGPASSVWRVRSVAQDHVTERFRLPTSATVRWVFARYFQAVCGIIIDRERGNVCGPPRRQHGARQSSVFAGFRSDSSAVNSPRRCTSFSPRTKVGLKSVFSTNISLSLLVPVVCQQQSIIRHLSTRIYVSGVSELQTVQEIQQICLFASHKWDETFYSSVPILYYWVLKAHIALFIPFIHITLQEY